MKTRTTRNATNGEIKRLGGIDMEVCVYCVNHLRDVCEDCTREGKFRNLEPEQLELGEFLPDLGSYRYWVNMNPYKIRALVYLHLFYRQRKEEGYS